MASVDGMMAGRGWSRDAGGARGQRAAPSAFARARGFGPYRVSYWRAKLDERADATSRGGEGGFVAAGVVELYFYR